MNKTSEGLFLTIDQGGHATRALLFDLEGRVMAGGFENISSHNPKENWVEQDPEEMLLSVECAIKKVVNSIGRLSKNIISASLLTQRSSIVCWDNQTGESLSPIISWQDRRAASWIKQFSQYDTVIHQTTGLFLTAHYGVSKLQWCMDHLPAVKKAFQNGRLAWGPVASFLIFNLIEQHPLLIDPANASRTLLYNFRSLDWDKNLLDLFGLPIDPLPRCVPTRYNFGDINVAGNFVPLQIVSGDQSAALFAYGQPEIETAYVNIGTGAFLQRPFNNYSSQSSRLLTSVVLQDGNEVVYILEGTVNGAGSAFLKMEEELGIDPALAQQHLPEWIKKANSPPLFLNGISGLGSPFWIPNFKSRFIGEGENWQKIVGVAESIGFLLQVNLEETLKLYPPPKKIIVSGGFSVIDGLCQIISDLSGIQVYRPVEYEATARGSAFLLAGRPDIWPDIKGGEWFKPEPNIKLNTRFKLWLSLMENTIKTSDLP